MISITVLGRALEVPENNSLLRGIQYLFPDRCHRGRFCWNSECGNSKFYYRLPGDPEERKARACRFIPVEGMVITHLSSELKFVIRDILDERPVRDAAETGDDEGEDFPEIKFS